MMGTSFLSSPVTPAFNFANGVFGYVFGHGPRLMAAARDCDTTVIFAPNPSALQPPAHFASDSTVVVPGAFARNSVPTKPFVPAWQTTRKLFNGESG